MTDTVNTQSRAQWETRQFYSNEQEMLQYSFLSSAASRLVQSYHLSSQAAHPYSTFWSSSVSSTNDNGPF